MKILAAEEKYQHLLLRYPGDRKGILDLAALETYHLANYQEAERLLNGLLDKDIEDGDALLALGDTHMEWAEEDESHYEDARFAYASFFDYHGEREDVLFRMLKYFIRTDKLKETQDLQRMLQSREDLNVDPEVYAELGGYWFDKHEYDEVLDVLFEAKEVESEIPEIHYHLARYFRYAQDPVEEEKALKAAKTLLERAAPLEKKRLAKLIDTYNRYGRSYWRRREYLNAEEMYRKAIERIEQAQEQRIFAQNPEFGQVYANLGDIYYYIDLNLDTSLSLYNQAEDNLYHSPELDYKIGYIDYSQEKYEEALLRFSRVMDRYPGNVNTLYSLANTLYSRDHFASAQGYYLHLLDQLEARKDRIPFLRIEDNPEHRSLLQFILKTYNNLGVTLQRLSDRKRDADKSSKALVNMTFSSEYYDILTREPETMTRGLTKNLAFLNQRGILYPESEFELQIYNRIAVDLEAVRF